MAEQRPMRMCDSCGQVDDHPRHVFGYAEGDGTTSAAIGAKALRAASEDDFEAIVAQVQDTTTIYKHMDCCRTDGCPDGSCNYVTEGAEDRKGDDLVGHLTSRDTSGDEARFLTINGGLGGVVEGGRNEDHPFPETPPSPASANDPATLAATSEEG